VSSLRSVEYFREEFHYDPEPQGGSLLSFLYDIPYFPPCGVFPPLRLLNQFLALGSCGGGMGPGVTWEPFTLDEDEYSELVRAFETTPLAELKSQSRYAWVKPVFDHSFDEVNLYLAWAAAVCQKHRDRWKATLREAGVGK
jgi:hypothetical protein